jgi:3-dehydroquinate dehydratase type I
MDGGTYQGTETTRMESLIRAAQEGFDFVDAELNVKGVNGFVRRLEAEGAKTIISYHDFNSTPKQRVLESVLKKEKKVGASICKIVTTAKTYSDSFHSLAFVRKHSRNTKLVCFAMGELGIPSRVLSPILGAYFTFASPYIGKETAIGQVPVRDLRALYQEFDAA